ncbi:MAG: hypothetical protein ABIQ95_14695 [Bdellovibrionia bacterium]
MSNFNEQDQNSADPSQEVNRTPMQDQQKEQNKPSDSQNIKTHSETAVHPPVHNEQGGEENTPFTGQSSNQAGTPPAEGRPVERNKSPGRTGARGTAAMDPQTRQEVARKGGLAVSRNKQHMAEIGRKGGQSVSKNREHMAQIGRKGGAASRGHR